MPFARTLERWLRPGRDLPHGAAPDVTASPLRGLGTEAREGEFAAIGLDALLAPHSALIERIRIAYGGEEGGFENQLAPLILRFAAFVHLLPATRDAHFRGAGGCLQCGLEVGFHALQAADGQIFSARGTVPARRAAAPRWRAAAFVTGLCSDVHRPAFEAAVRAEDGAAWHPLLMPLTEWLRQGRRDRYFIEWSHVSAIQPAATLAILQQLLGAPLLAFLAEPERTVLDHVVAALAAPPGTGSNALGVIVQQTRSRVVARDLRRAPTRRFDLPIENADEPIASEDPLPPAPTEGSAAGATETCTASPRGLAASEPARAPVVDPPRLDGKWLADEPGTLFPEPTLSPTPPRRRLSIPATLNPVVAEALVAMLSPPPGVALAVGIEISEEGIYVPLGVWDQGSLDTGLVVRALHDAHLLVVQGTRKVWRKRIGGADVPGLMLNARLLA